MGEIRAEMRLENAADRALFEEGHLPATSIRFRRVEGIADTGAVTLLLPQELVEALGLKTIQRVIVALADDRKIELDKAGPILLTISGRKMYTNCLVGPPGCEALIGQIVMEELDLIADPRLRTLTPRPESPFAPTLKMRREAACCLSFSA